MRSPRRLAACAAVALLTSWCGPAPQAAAIAPPVVDPGPPPGGPPGPLQPTEQKAVCGIPTGVLPGTDFAARTGAEAMLEYRAAWRFSRGKGQKVAVIDTGVNPQPRLPGLQGGGDYVSDTNGLKDCDAHGTLVAGIVAGAPLPTDSFAGVAPEATILSIRQNSGVYSVKGGGGNQLNDPNANSPGYGNTETLARAVARAVDLGATVINLSEVACAPVGAGLQDAALGRAVRFAFEHNVVVVAAAGNFSTQGTCSTQNAMPDPDRPLATGWDSVRTVATPAWFSDYVLTVGAVTPTAAPADFSLRGPWLALAAPGERITSLDANGPGLINAERGPQGLAPINGTSFAAPFVSGVVALVRSRFPALSAGQVMDLLKRTARGGGDGPNEATGYGIVDPVAALTAQLPAADQLPQRHRSTPIAGRPTPSPQSMRAKVIVFGVAVASVAVMCAAAAIANARTRRR